MKIFKSLDFKSQRERIEPSKSGEYLVHLEDYESLNDLIRRSVRTKSVFKPVAPKDEHFDGILDDVQEEFEKYEQMIDRNQPAANVAGLNAPAGERSEAKGEVSQPADESKVDLP